MAIYLDQKRRCDNCLHELGTARAIPCKGETAYMCRKELCAGCRGKQAGWCRECVGAELVWLAGDGGFCLEEDPVFDAIEHIRELRMLEHWNKIAQA